MTLKEALQIAVVSIPAELDKHAPPLPEGWTRDFVFIVVERHPHDPDADAIIAMQALSCCPTHIAQAIAAAYNQMPHAEKTPLM